MNNNILKINSNTYQLFENNKSIGTISTYTNDYHNQNCNLKFNLLTYPLSSPFSLIMQDKKKPLQVMLDSTEKYLIAFLTKNGFQLKRRCFSLIVKKDNMKLLPEEKIAIQKFDMHNNKYLDCCDFLYQYYKNSHKVVSPLTVSKDQFIKEVPTKTGYYQLNKDCQIENIIFTENNEIAYICSTNSKTCPQFIQSVLLDIFSSFESIFFEADDTDWAAMDLLHQFDIDVTQSFNTYILDTSVTRNKLDNDL